MSTDSTEKSVTDAERLKKLYEDRVPKDMSQAEFGSLYGIGTKAMVWQYITGYRPLNFEAAAKFAKGLRCTIADISPEMARKLKADILPVLGRVSIKAALALVLVLPPYAHQKAEAAFNIIKTEYTLRLRRLFALLRLRHRNQDPIKVS